MRLILGDLPESQLTEIKNTKGITPVPGNEAVAGALLGIVNTMIDELGIRMHYWHTRKIDRGERQIKKILLCGGSSNLWGLPEHLSDTLGLSVERANVWHNAFSLEHTIPPIERAYSYGYATAIGLALRGFYTAP
jgi:Tfp pilus assembly PilM family ATPase